MSHNICANIHQQYFEHFASTVWVLLTSEAADLYLGALLRTCLSLAHYRATWNRSSLINECVCVYSVIFWDKLCEFKMEFFSIDGFRRRRWSSCITSASCGLALSFICSILRTIVFNRYDNTVS